MYVKTILIIYIAFVSCDMQTEVESILIQIECKSKWIGIIDYGYVDNKIYTTTLYDKKGYYEIECPIDLECYRAKIGQEIEENNNIKIRIIEIYNDGFENILDEIKSNDNIVELKYGDY